jgi:hypothetical protein
MPVTVTKERTTNELTEERGKERKEREERDEEE